VPIGLKDLYGVAGKPLTASSRALDETPSRDCDAWVRLRAAGMVLLGHLHTHEFAAGGTTDQTGNPWSLDRSAGGSSGGSAAALAARMTPAATGTDTAGSLRIPSACAGVSTIKPTRGLVSLAGVVPLAATLDHAGPMARSLADCALLLAAMVGPDAGWASSAIPRVLLEPPAPQGGAKPLEGVRLAVSPRIDVVESLDPDVADAFAAVLDLSRSLGAELVQAPRVTQLDILSTYFDVFGAEMLAYHRRFDQQRDLYRPSIRQFVEMGESRALHAWEYVQAQAERRETTARWTEWLAAEQISGIVEPTIPVVAPTRGTGYERAGSDTILISFTHYWDWTGFPAIAFPVGIGSRSQLPTSVSLVGPAGSDGELLRIGIELQAELGIPVPPEY
jgi:aspartyl-tRNA(Asn)/glutamyl-tRNA(Gln) amidotransferase subunit A